MLLVLPESSDSLDSGMGPGRWVRLPGLCCQAAGGKLESTVEISAAWLLMYTAAHVFDSIEDGDYDPQVKRLGGAGPAANAATGLLLSASLILTSLQEKVTAGEVPAGVAVDYLDTILEMASGQHLDLIAPEIKLDQWWQIAGAKSGAFFSLACRSGAQFAKCDKLKINSFSDYGYHLGLMLQILDDLDDFNTLIKSKENGIPVNLHKSLAVAYAQSVLAEKEGDRLSQLIQTASPFPELGDEIIDMLDKCGAGLYMVAALENQFELGIASLAEGHPEYPAREELDKIIHLLKNNKTDPGVEGNF